jgi:hypothetical protein
MNNIKFNGNIWQTYHSLWLDMYQYDSKGRYKLDLVLNNTYVAQMNVSEMNLKITKITAFDANGKEHIVVDFKESRLMKIKGIFQGYSIKSQSIPSLGNGLYKTLRFYINDSESSFVCSDKNTKSIFGNKFLDFEIKNGLNITGNEAPEAVLRFDLVPFERFNYLKLVTDLFKKSQSLTGKLASRLGIF